jgi:ABC-2 type transport system ATP-binding protein
MQMKGRRRSRVALSIQPSVVLQLDAVYKSFGPVQALDGLSLQVEAGEIVAVLGPNGAGKTTSIDIAVGLRRPSRGTARLFGLSPADARARRNLGTTPQESGFPDALTVEEILRFVGVHYERPRPVDEVLTAFDLDSLRKRRAGTLSVGQSRRLALALAFAGDPQLVVLDEPTAGLDVESRRRFWQFVRTGGAGRAILFSTHYLEEAETAASRIVVIDHGRIRFDGDPHTLRARFGIRQVTYTGRPLSGIANAHSSVGHDGRTVVATPDSDGYVRALVVSGVEFSDLQISSPSLEEAFLALTQEAQ